MIEVMINRYGNEESRAHVGARNNSSDALVQTDRILDLSPVLATAPEQSDEETHHCIE